MVNYFVPGFRLKGSGWYETDFKDKGKKTFIPTIIEVKIIRKDLTKNETTGNLNIKNLNEDVTICGWAGYTEEETMVV